MKTNLYGAISGLFKFGGLTIFSFLAWTSVHAQTIDIGPNQYAFQFTNDPDFGLFFNSTNSQYEFRNGAASPVFAIGANNGQLRSDLTFGSGSDYLVGPDRYAFRYSGNQNFGLVFNNTNSQYEFRNGSASAVFAINALNGQLKSDLQFDPGASYLVAPNNYAIRSAANANIGLYFGPSDYEFRNSSGVSVLNIDANTGEIISTSSINADGGSSADWTQAHSWGDHAAAGYLSSENDPKVGTLSNNTVPTWNGSSLENSPVTTGSDYAQVDGSIASFRVNSTGFLGGTGKFHFFTNDNDNAEIAYGLGQLQIMNKVDVGSILFGTNGVLHSAFDDEGRLGVNNTNPTARLDVEGDTVLTEDVIQADATYSGFVDVRAVDARSITEEGYGIGVYGTGGWQGVRGDANSGAYTGFSYGVRGSASGTAGTRIGVYGSAFGGDANWAMYAQGDSYVSGDLRVGSTVDAAGYRLSVDGNIICEEVRVLPSGSWPDYVFSDEYELRSIDDLENYIDQENHLPGLPSASEIDNGQGFDVGEMQRLTVEKIEELTLYLIEANKKMEELAKQNEALRQEINELKND